MSKENLECWEAENTPVRRPQKTGCYSTIQSMVFKSAPAVL